MSSELIISYEKVCYRGEENELCDGWIARWQLGSNWGRTKLEALEHLREMGHECVDSILGRAIAGETGRMPDYCKWWR